MWYGGNEVCGMEVCGGMRECVLIHVSQGILCML